jgi:peptidyl-prolyl cis-trans isomerase D
MINLMRRMLNSWLAVAILTLVLAAFVITGINSFQSSGAGNQVAKVGSQEIGAGDYVEQAQQRLKIIQQQQPTASMGEFAKAGGLEQVFNFLVQRAAVGQVMQDMKISAGKEQQIAAISSIAAFKVGNDFSKAKFEETLARNKMTPNKFYKALDEDLARDQLIGAMTKGWALPKSALLAYAKLIEEKRTATIAYVSASSQPRAELPDEQVLLAYYTKNKKNYMAPETRAFKYFVVSPATIMETIKVSEADLKKAFDENKAEYGGVELRRVSQVLLDDAEAAKAVSAAGGTAAGFLAAAQKAVPGLTEEDLSLGDVAQADLEKDAGKDASRAVFALKGAGVTAPINSDRGWLVFRVENVMAPKAATLAAVRPEVEAKVRSEKAIDALYDLTKDLEDAAGKGQTIDQLAKIAKAVVSTAPAVDKQGRGADGAPTEIAAQIPAVLRLAFEKDAGEDLTVEEIDAAGNGYAVVETTKVTESAARPFTDVKPMVTNAWLRDTLNAKAKAGAESLIAAVKAGKALAPAAKSINAPVREGASGSRLSVLQTGQQIGPLEQKIFSLRKGEAGMAAAPNGDGFFVIQVTEATPMPVNEQSVSYQMLLQSSAQVGAQEGLQQFIVAARKSYGEKYNQAALTAVKNQLTGVDTQK